MWALNALLVLFIVVWHLIDVLNLLVRFSADKRSKTYEMPANTEDPFRCPVRFIEFYLTRW